MLASIWLVIVMIAVSVLILAASLYVLVYFQSEEDRNTAWAPKIAVVLGLTLTCLLVLMLPLDVANRSCNGGLPMEFLWQMLYLAVAIMCIGVVPFLMFYYEAWDPESNSWQLCTAVKYEVCTVLIVGATLFFMWLGLGYADVPLDELSYNVSLLPASQPIPACESGLCGGPIQPTSLRVSVTPVVYLVAIVAFVGWFLFTCALPPPGSPRHRVITSLRRAHATCHWLVCTAGFAGVGLMAMPMDLVADYRTRPQPMDLEE